MENPTESPKFDHKKLTHSISACQSRTDQNQNEDSPLHTHRMTKSTSWFSSLTRKASRKTPSKKRSFAYGSTLDNMNPNARPRLNKSDWDVRKTDSSPMNHTFHNEELNFNSSRSTDCLDIDATATGTLCDPVDCDLSSTRNLHQCSCCQLNDSVTPNRSVKTREKMRKYHAVIRLNSTNSCSDMSTLNLTTFDESRPELDLVLNVDGQPITTYYTIDSRRLASKHQKTQHDRKLLNGIKQFNLEPEKGLKYLEESGFLEKTPESVAKFLFRQERLSKKQIGKYLGSHHEFNQTVLSHFVQCHQFSQLLLVQALRQFLWSFRLPGEAMQIDRVMDCFAAHYCAQNPDIFEETDTCFILSFSIIMLNTALHNPNSKMKITSEQFIKQNKGINSGKDLASDMLDAIFRNIKEEPFKIPDENYDDLMYTFFSPEREGWLLKQGGSWKSWKRRWFVLNDRCLYYFQHTAENVPKGIIPLENVRVRPLEDKDGKNFAFEIYSEMADIVKGCKTDSSGTVVQGNHHHYRMSASTKEDRDTWIQCIQDSIEDNPFSKIIADKKAAIRQRSTQRFPDNNFHKAQHWADISH